MTERVSGFVKWYTSIKGYGFLAQLNGGRDVFVHHSAVKKAGVLELKEGQKLTFDVNETPRGLSASNLTVD